MIRVCGNGVRSNTGSCGAGDRLSLITEPNNQYGQKQPHTRFWCFLNINCVYLDPKYLTDDKAVRVVRDNDLQNRTIGHVRRRLSSDSLLAFTLLSSQLRISSVTSMEASCRRKEASVAGFLVKVVVEYGENETDAFDELCAICS